MLSYEFKLIAGSAVAKVQFFPHLLYSSQELIAGIDPHFAKTNNIGTLAIAMS